MGKVRFHDCLNCGESNKLECVLKENVILFGLLHTWLYEKIGAETFVMQDVLHFSRLSDVAKLPLE